MEPDVLYPKFKSNFEPIPPSPPPPSGSSLIPARVTRLFRLCLFGLVRRRHLAGANGLDSGCRSWWPQRDAKRHDAT